MDSILYNLKPYITADFYNGLKIDIWHIRREDIPLDRIGRADVAGLTWSKDKKIELEILDFSTELTRDIYLSNLLSHELGHYFQEYINFDNSLLKPKWLELRGKDEVIGTNNIELFAEDFRLLFGSPLAKDLKRGNYIQATDKPFLKDLMLLIKPFNDYYNDLNKSYWFYDIKKLQIKTEYSCGILFYEDYGYLQWYMNKWVYILS